MSDATTRGMIIDRLLRRHRLAWLAPRFLPHLKPAVGLALTRKSRGLSRFGGRPLLPRNFEWPSWRPVSFEHASPTPRVIARRFGEPTPLDFLLQIDLADLRRAAPSSRWPLPDSGLLTFFYDVREQPWGHEPEEMRASRVVLVDGRLEERSVPRESRLQFRWLDLFETLTLPTYGSRDCKALEEWGELPDDYFELVSELERHSYPYAGGLHRMLGHSTNIQGDMQHRAQVIMAGLSSDDVEELSEAAFDAYAENAGEWMLLLQVDSEPDAGAEWGDSGRIYFWIRREDVEANRWDEVCVMLQCT